MKIRPARHADLAAVREMLAAAGLPAGDIGDHLATLLVGEQRGVIAAAGALEPLGAACLLRSIVVAPAFRGRGWGNRITLRLLDLARSLRVRDAFLLTTDAGPFFVTHGFAPVDRDVAPERVRRTRQFGELCPATAVLMHARVEADGSRSRRPAAVSLQDRHVSEAKP